MQKPITQRAQFDESFAQARHFARLSMFFGLLAALLGVTLVALAGSAIPARRAASVDPIVALRYESLQLFSISEEKFNSDSNKNAASGLAIVAAFSS